MAAFFFSASKGPVDEVWFAEGFVEFSCVLEIAQEELLTETNQVHIYPRSSIDTTHGRMDIRILPTYQNRCGCL